jgi:predicted RNA-binding Zn ribbon-like protein
VRHRFHSGRTSLDFVHTGGDRFMPFELLRDADELGRWLAVLLGIDRVDAVAGDVRAAHTLRGALRRCADVVIAGKGPTQADLDVLNAAAAYPPVVPVLTTELQASVKVASAGQALSSLARDAIDLFSGPLAGRLRECAAPDCALLFVDTSRPGGRRWCSMELCGSRSKARAYRSRST